MTNFFTGRSVRFSVDTDEDYSETVDEIMRKHFLALVGSVVDYYGADGGEHEFKIDSVVFKVVEDPDDGYRSHLGTIEYSDESKGIFFGTPIAQVKIETYDGPDNDPDLGSWRVNHGYRLVDIVDDHIWLEFGTHNYDDYYPCFIFRHHPKAP